MTEKKFVEQKGGSIWLPLDVKEVLEGTVKEINEGEYGKQYTIEKENGEMLVTPSHRALVGRMVKVKVGDTVRLTFTGEELPKVKGHNPTKLYKVEVEE